MQPVPSTAQILAYKVLNRITEKVWVDWAYDMLIAGFDTEHLVILAGTVMPLEYFEMSKLTDKVLDELNLDYSDTDEVMGRYASFLTNRSLNGEMEAIIVLNELKEIYLELDYYTPLQHFYMLYFAKQDLRDSEDQWYVENLDRSNIDANIEAYFKLWAKP